MSDTLSGFLLWGDSLLVKSAFSRLKRLSKSEDPTEGWHRFCYAVDEEVPGVEAEEGPPFIHPLLARWGGNRLIILSNNHRVCDHFLDRDLRREMQGFLKKADILVHELVVALCGSRKGEVGEASVEGADRDAVVEGTDVDWREFESRYILGQGFARSDAFGGNLHKIEFEGDDLTLVPLFVDAIPLLRFRSCGLRHRIVDDRGFPSSAELIRLGKSGFISFTLPTSENSLRERFRHVEAVLRSLNRCGFIK